MNRNKLKQYAPQARRDFIAAVTDRAAHYGLTKGKIEPITEQGEVALLGGIPFPRHVAAKRKRLEERINRQGFEQVMEAMAYTWFNRLVAIRYMELHGYLDHGYRVLSHPEGKTTPEIIEHAEHVDLPGLETAKVIDLKLAGTKEAELYRMLLVAQCNALHSAMPFLFERINDETELLLPDNLLHSDSLIRKLVSSIDEEDWQEVEIIGWLYQFYISEKKDEVIGKVVKSEDIPAATQLFTPNWIVKYMVQNTLGRQWMATYPDSRLKEQMEFYIEPAEQTTEVQAQLREITPDSLNPEELTLLDPACGSGHILVEAYDILKAIYLERGYRLRDIPQLILEKNLYGLEIDDRAAQLSALALIMKAREDDRRIFASEVQPNVLAIQESKGISADDFALPQEDIITLLSLFDQSKIYGSLISIPPELTRKLPTIAKEAEKGLACSDLLNQAAWKSLLMLINQAQLLSRQYDAVIVNPPYMSGKAMNAELKEFAKKCFPDSKSDTFAMFIERSSALTRDTGYAGFVTPFVWMFISSYEKLRKFVLSNKTIVSLVKPSYTSFFESAIVPLVTFVIKMEIENVRGNYFDLGYLGSPESQPIKLKEGIQNSYCDFRYKSAPEDFKKIPGSPIAYWVNDRVREVFQSGRCLDNVYKPRKGIDTGNNELFLRFWFEVDISKIGFSCFSDEESINSEKKWFPYNKGGDYRKWYGNFWYVVNWENGGNAIRNYTGPNGKLRSNLRNQEYFFKRGVTWTDVSSSSFGARLLPDGFLCDNSGSACYGSESLTLIVLGFLTTNIAFELLKILNPTLHFQAGNLSDLPLLSLTDDVDEKIRSLGNIALHIAKHDWDLLETSWDFGELPMLQDDLRAVMVQGAYCAWERLCQERVDEMQRLEEENNLLFIEAYGLQDEISHEVPEDQITLYRPDQEEDTRRLISYTIGCMMGRYSLDKPGLIYAHSGNQGFDSSQYQTFPADDDGIIPISDDDWFPDDATNRVEAFIATAWPKEHLEENLKFIAESLGPNRNEQPRETIRRYLATGFFKHHLSIYKRRPIYWLFSSGKQRAFQCLVYLHRYNEGTLSRMRTEYVIPLQGKIASRIGQLDDDIAAATSTSHRKRLEKERDKLLKQQAELQTYDEKLRHYADRRIRLDLDDGVKVNYAKFGDLLAEVKAVTGSTQET